LLPGGDDRWSRECRDAHKGGIFVVAPSCGNRTDTRAGS